MTNLTKISILIFSILLPLSLIAQGAHDPMSINLPYLVNHDLPDPVHQEGKFIKLEEQGKFQDLSNMIDEYYRTTGCGFQVPTYYKESTRIFRIKRDFDLGSDELLKKIQIDIPDATLEDLIKWKEAGDIQWIRIDGKECFFRKEPRNLYRRNKEARQRKEAATKQAVSQEDTSAQRGFSLHDHLTDVLKEVDETGSDRAITVTMTATQTLTVPPGVVPTGELVRCWIPFPQEYHRQRGVELLETSSPEPAIIDDHPQEKNEPLIPNNYFSKPGNSFPIANKASSTPIIAPNGSPHRTVYLEQNVADHATTLTFFIKYRYTTEAYIPNIEANKVTPYDKESDIYQEYTAEDPPHIKFTPEVKVLANKIVGEETNPLLKADKLFRWMDGNIGYCSEMEYSIMPSIIDKIMYEREGDCGIQAIMFINLCRAVGVPARWQSGWAMRPNAANLHDWAEFYVEPYGWLPADPSFGLRNHDDPRIRNFYIGHIDSYRLIANLGFNQPLIPEKHYYRSDNIDNQRGELEWERGNIYYDDFKYKMEIEYEYK